MSSNGSLAWIISQELSPPEPIDLSNRWPDYSVPDPIGRPVDMHLAQRIGFDSPRRIVALIAGNQGGKTGFGPVKLWQWIRLLGGGDWFAVTSTFDLFKLKMLPALLHFFEEKLKLGRYWTSDRILELANPKTGLFYARRSTDPMWARIILRSADSKGGLEAATGKGAWLDEAGQKQFDIDSWNAIQRRLSITQGPILVTSTLYEPGVLDTEIIDKAEQGGSKDVIETDRGEIEVTDNAEKDICLIQFDSTINPVYPEEEFERAEAEMPPDQFAAFFRGRRVRSRLMVYDIFDRKLNTCQRFEIPATWPRILGIDPGGTHLAAIALAEDPSTAVPEKRDKKGNLVSEGIPPIMYAYMEYMEGGRSALEHNAKLRTFAPGYQSIYCGAKSEGQWRKEFGQSGTVSGELVPGMRTLEPKVVEVAVQVNRVYAQFKLRRLIIFDDLTGLLSDLTKMRRKRDGQGNILDEIENERQYHFHAALRYPVSSLRPGGRPRATVMRLSDAIAGRA